MCCCRTRNVNGTAGAYSWDGKSFGTYPPAPPKLDEGDELIYDEPGRCGGTFFRGHKRTCDSHSHHFRVVRSYGSYYLMVEHGGGRERFGLGVSPGIASLENVDSETRYWLLQMIYNIHREAATKSRDAEKSRWTKAAYDRRIKVNRRGRRHTVEILPEPAPAGAAA